MKTSAKLATLLATGSLLFAAAPAFAASTMTLAFIANVRPNVDFLDRSSRLAFDKSPSSHIRSFARSEAREQTITGNSLVAWVETNTGPGEAVAVGAPVVPVAPLVTAPLTVAGDVVTGTTDVVTGRSVAIDPVPLTVTPAPAPTPVGSGLLPADEANMQQLRALDGTDFDRLYRSTQADSLRQLATLYRSYIQNGDDDALRAMAVRELPKINHRLAELSRI